MTIKEQYHSFLQQIQTIYNLNEATVITDWVFESLADIKRFDIIKDPDQQLVNLKNKEIEIALSALLQHKPIQYVLGEAWFYNMKLKVNGHVLIPRPETEELVQLILNEEKHFKMPAVLDIGTGSGCIAIALKKDMPQAIVTAIDVSKEALLVAKGNATSQQCVIQFLQVDFLDESQWARLPMFDMIISNPPYIPITEKDKMDNNVTLFEPHKALFVPDDSPLLFYKKIAGFADKHLNPNGKIFMETHEDFANQTAALFLQQLKEVTIQKDIFGKERMVIAAY